MLLSPFAATLARLADKALQLITGCPPARPSFDNLLDELFETWPLDAEEEMSRRAAPRFDLPAAAPAAA